MCLLDEGNTITSQFLYKKNWLNFLLLPASGIYAAIVFIRKKIFAYHIKKVTYFNVPVIVVGNITVGGTGKTPVVAWLAQYLKNNNYRPGIVSRGYKGQAKTWPQIVEENSNPVLVGDEPVWLKKKTQCPMVVGPSRVAAVKKLLENFSCDIVISDDGLQHYALGRDLEIALVNEEKQYSNHFYLPAGPLRESKKRLQEVDLVLVKNKDYYLKSKECYQVNNPTNKLSLHDMKTKTIHAVAGIGHPEKFFQQLLKLGLNIIPHPFPDHYGFQPNDINFGANSLVLMTEKDAVKCQSFVDERHYCLPIDVVFSDDALALLNRLLRKVLI